MAYGGCFDRHMDQSVPVSLTGSVYPLPRFHRCLMLKIIVLMFLLSSTFDQFGIIQIVKKLTRNTFKSLKSPDIDRVGSLD